MGKRVTLGTDPGWRGNGLEYPNIPLPLDPTCLCLPRFLQLCQGLIRPLG